MNQMQKNVFLTYFKTTFLLIITFCLGCFIATSVARLLDKSKDSEIVNKPDPTDLRSVFALKNTVHNGKEISPENIIVVQLHKNEVPRTAVKTYQQIEGRVIRSEIPQGTILLDEYFVPHITKNPNNGFIPPGFHSVAIQIHEAVIDGQSSISAVLPGDQVDVIIVQQDEDKDDVLNEFVLLEKIPVIDTVWDEIGVFRKNEQKGTVSLLLSDSQRKNLEEEYQNATKIRLRICPPVETQTVSALQPQSPVKLVTSSDFYQTGNQPELISRSLGDDTPPIEIVFRNKQELKPINHKDFQIPSFRGIPADTYADANAGISSASALDKQKSIAKPDYSPSVSRYSSFFDAAGGNKGKNGTQWRAVVPQPPLVFEARPNFDTQARGIYRDGGVYYSVD